MANTLDPMDLKQIISLHLDGYSNRKIGTSLSISRNTVNTYIHLFKGSDYTFKVSIRATTWYCFDIQVVVPQVFGCYDLGFY